MWRRDFMSARDRAEAIEVLDLLLKFFGEGERWVKGRLSDRRGNRCLVRLAGPRSQFARLAAGGRWIRTRSPSLVGAGAQFIEERSTLPRVMAALKQVLRAIPGLEVVNLSLARIQGRASPTRVSRRRRGGGEDVRVDFSVRVTENWSRRRSS
jgi:hypothetical protein